jgi:hypothetical protein
MRITSGGFVGINTTSPQDRLDVNGSIRFRGNTPNFTAVLDNAVIDFVPTSIFPTEPCIRMAAIGTASVGAEIRFLTGTSTTVSTRLTINATGAATFTSSVTATSFFESSDSRIKTLIYDNYQTKGIESITPKLYNKNGKTELGYYAQDFVGILDNAISKGSDDMLSLSYREVHTAKIYSLEQEIKQLKSELNSIKNN